MNTEVRCQFIPLLEQISLSIWFKHHLLLLSVGLSSSDVKGPPSRDGSTRLPFRPRWCLLFAYIDGWRRTLSRPCSQVFGAEVLVPRVASWDRFAWRA